MTLRNRIGVHRHSDWRPYLGRGTDEWCNPALSIGLPFLVAVDVFYSRHSVDRSGWWLSGGHFPKDGPASVHYVSPDGQQIATVEYDHDPFDDPCPHTRADDWIMEFSSKIESLDSDEG